MDLTANWVHVEKGYAINLNNFDFMDIVESEVENTSKKIYVIQATRYRGDKVETHDLASYSRRETAEYFRDELMCGRCFYLRSYL